MILTTYVKIIQIGGGSPILHNYLIFKKVDRMTTAIYFNEVPTQRNARGNSERTDDAWRNLIQRLRN